MASAPQPNLPLFFKDLMHGLKCRSREKGKPLALGTYQDACKVHGRSWHGLPRSKTITKP